MDCKIIPALQEDLDMALEQAYYRTKEPKTCIICGSKFYQGRSDVDVCGECYIDFTCPQCGKEHCRIKLDYRGRIRSIKKSLFPKVVTSKTMRFIVLSYVQRDIMLL